LSDDRVPLEASRLHEAAGFQGGTAVPPSQSVEATILVRRRPAAGAGQRIEAILRGEEPTLSREQAAEALGADPEDLRRVVDFAASYGLAVTESSPAKRSVKVSGTVAQMEAAFGVNLRGCRAGEKTYLCYQGALTIPASLDQVVVGVLGLDQRPVAQPHP
jgi:kumamolisin